MHIDGEGVAWLKASVRDIPEDGKANKALIRLLARRLGIPKSDIELAGGHTSRNKILKFPASPNVIKMLVTL